MSTKHNHNEHKCTCSHSEVKFCAHCNTVYCLNCNQEWTAKSTWNWNYPYITYTSGSLQNLQTPHADTFKDAVPMTLTSTSCGHKV